MTQRTEALLMGLRLSRGINRAAWRERFGQDVLACLNEAALAPLLTAGFATINDDQLCLTSAGMMRGDGVLRRLV